MTVAGEGADIAMSVPSRPSTGKRVAFERRRRRRSSLIAVASTSVVVAALVVLIPLTPGWDKVSQAFFNGATFRSSLPKLVGPFLFNIKIFLLCAPCILLVGLLIAMARNVRSPALYPLKLFATLYTDIVRGVPVILWITLIGFGVPALFEHRAWYTKLVVWGSVALVMCYSAYVAEVLRAGIESVHESQRAAARSLGLSTGQMMRSVILPQAARRVVPPLMNDLVSLQKDVALLSIVGAVEALRKATILQAKDYNFTHLVAAAVLFLLVSVPLTRLTDHIVTRQRRRTSATAIS